MKKRRSGAPISYPAGHFTEPVRAWFGQHWKSAIDCKSSNATSYQTRQRGLEEGASWASGTISKLGANTAPSEGWRAKLGIR